MTNLAAYLCAKILLAFILIFIKLIIPQGDRLRDGDYFKMRGCPVCSQNRLKSNPCIFVRVERLINNSLWFDGADPCSCRAHQG